MYKCKKSLSQSNKELMKLNVKSSGVNSVQASNKIKATFNHKENKKTSRITKA
jgi:hypothetical protein